jgi:hypothetical protein
MTYDLDTLARLLAALPPAPEGWVAAAQELPRARQALDSLVERAEADVEFRARVLADLEGALAEAGVTPTPSVIELVRQRLA